MNIDQELIDSGNLEAYVCGVLSNAESREISSRLRGNLPLRYEVERIEACYMKLAQGVAPQNDEHGVFDRLSEIINTNQATELKRTSPLTYLGWAAAVVFLISSGYLFTALNGSNTNNDNLQYQVTQIEQKNDFLNQEISDSENLNNLYEETLVFIKDKNTIKVNLAGQKGFEGSTATAFHNAAKDVTYIDISRLPKSPDDKTYQLWSLTLNPLTPTSLGVVSNRENMIKIQNSNDSEAFGITLEPMGGSPSPNLEQLYTLGVISKG
jgi:anti-sigma-K factor RskA/uncharacterized protein YfkK (UPF0435 family)